MLNRLKEPLSPLSQSEFLSFVESSSLVSLTIARFDLIREFNDLTEIFDTDSHSPSVVVDELSYRIIRLVAIGRAVSALINRVQSQPLINLGPLENQGLEKPLATPHYGTTVGDITNRLQQVSEDNAASSKGLESLVKMSVNPDASATRLIVNLPLSNGNSRR